MLWNDCIFPLLEIIVWLCIYIILSISIMHQICPFSFYLTERIYYFYLSNTIPFVCFLIKIDKYQWGENNLLKLSNSYHIIYWTVIIHFFSNHHTYCTYICRSNHKIYIQTRDTHEAINNLIQWSKHVSH